jgi:hypothetical protein
VAEHASLLSVNQVLDLEGLVPTKEQWEKSWVRFFAQAYGTLASLAHRNGIAPDAMIELEDTVDGEHFIWVQYDLALDYAAYISPDLRANILITYRRALSGDITLAEEILERSSDNEQQRWLQARRKLQQHTPIRNSAIKKHQGHGWICPYCTDELNKATTGHCFVANCAQKVMKGQLPWSVEGLRGQGIELFSRSEAFFFSSHYHLSFLDHVHEFDPDQGALSCIKRFEPQHRPCHPLDGSMVLFHDVV